MATSVYQLYRWLWSGLDWVLPPVCGGCERRGERWCTDCQQAAHPLQPPLCERCGLPQERPGLCNLCQGQPPAFNGLRAWAVYEGPLRKAIHRLKYRRDLGLGEALAHRLVELLKTQPWEIDFVTPVPLSPERYRERMYNQAALLALPLALASGLHYSSQALARRRNTASQVRLTRTERLENVRDAFQADPAAVSGRNILVVDDVTTTGATLSACAEALHAAGARQVYCLTLAVALHLDF